MCQAAPVSIPGPALARALCWLRALCWPSALTPPGVRPVPCPGALLQGGNGLPPTAFSGLAFRAWAAAAVCHSLPACVPGAGRAGHNTNPSAGQALALAAGADEAAGGVRAAPARRDVRGRAVSPSRRPSRSGGPRSCSRPGPARRGGACALCPGSPRPSAPPARPPGPGPARHHAERAAAGLPRARLPAASGGGGPQQGGPALPLPGARGEGRGAAFFPLRRRRLPGPAPPRPAELRWVPVGARWVPGCRRPLPSSRPRGRGGSRARALGGLGCVPGKRSVLLVGEGGDDKASGTSCPGRSSRAGMETFALELLRAAYALGLGASSLEGL